MCCRRELSRRELALLRDLKHSISRVLDIPLAGPLNGVPCETGLLLNGTVGYRFLPPSHDLFFGATSSSPSHEKHIRALLLRDLKMKRHRARHKPGRRELNRCELTLLGDLEDSVSRILDIELQGR